MSKLSIEQEILVSEFSAYGINPEEILFYSEKAEPFFTYEATSALCRELTDIQSIDVESFEGFGDSTSIKCRVMFPDGTSRSATGTVNNDEKIDGREMSQHQRIALASARAIRNTLKASGINLLKAHRQREKAPVIDSQLRNKLLAECHALAEECGFIFGQDKTFWRSMLRSRYQIDSSGDLSVHELTDLVAFLRACLPEKLQKAA